MGITCPCRGRRYCARRIDNALSSSPTSLAMPELIALLVLAVLSYAVINLPGDNRSRSDSRATSMIESVSLTEVRKELMSKSQPLKGKTELASTERAG